MQQETTSSEFVRWMAYRDHELRISSKEDWYLAQIAREVHTVLWKSSDKKKVRVKDFLLKFNIGTRKEEVKNKPSKDIQNLEMQKSKGFWNWFLGAKKKDE